MKHTYKLSGMTCSSCEAKIKSGLEAHKSIKSVTPNKDEDSVEIEMTNHLSLEILQPLVREIGEKYHISYQELSVPTEEKSFWAKYKPVFMIFIYVTTLSSIATWQSDQGTVNQWMRYFMAGFFIAFSFFKLLNISGFADSYAMYDVVAKRWRSWGFIYPFVELGLGLAFLMNLDPVVVNSATFVVMGVSLIGVLQSVLSKTSIKCACLGDVFDLPMSTVTIIEDALMVLMSGYMLIQALSI